MPPSHATTTTSAYVVVFNVTAESDTASSHNVPTPDPVPPPALDTSRVPIPTPQRAERVPLSSVETKAYVAAPVPRARSPPSGQRAGAVFW